MAMQERDAQPMAARLRLPPAYGAPQDTALMSWPSVSERLEQASHYWLCTVGPGPTPTPRPLDGVWFGNVLYFGGDPATRWRRNVSACANASLHLEDAESPVMVEGEVRVMGAPEELATTIAERSQTKYGWGSVKQYRTEVCVFIPHRAMAWSGLFENATRFTFPDPADP